MSQGTLLGGLLDGYSYQYVCPHFVGDGWGLGSLKRKNFLRLLRVALILERPRRKGIKRQTENHKIVFLC